MILHSRNENQILKRFIHFRINSRRKNPTESINHTDVCHFLLNSSHPENSWLQLPLFFVHHQGALKSLVAIVNDVVCMYLQARACALLKMLYKMSFNVLQNYIRSWAPLQAQILRKKNNETSKRTK